MTEYDLSDIIYHIGSVVLLSAFIFTWDENKEEINIRKHNITFSEAETVFDDENLLYGMDVKHSVNEERFYVIGISRRTRLLMVCHCMLTDGITVRIISARKANKDEIQRYKRR